MKTFIDAIKMRRSIYALNREIGISEDELKDIVSELVKNVPSAFNSQTSRLVILFGDESLKLWNIVEKTLKPLVPEDSFGSTQAKLASFAAGAGTILFFEEDETVQSLQKQFPLYSDVFPLWSLQSGGMIQFAVWTALAEKNIGASLQHYNPLIDAEVKKEWDLPESWKLLAQMPFGGIASPANEKEFMPIEKRVKTFS